MSHVVASGEIQQGPLRILSIDDLRRAFSLAPDIKPKKLAHDSMRTLIRHMILLGHAVTPTEIYTLVQVLTYQLLDTEAVLSEFELLRRLGLPIGLDAYLIVLRRQVQQSNPALVRPIYQELRRRELLKTSRDYTKCLSIHRVAADGGGLMVLLETLRCEKQDLDASIYEGAIVAFVRCRNLPQALELHREMRQREIKPTKKTLTSLTHGCLRANFTSQAEFFIREYAQEWELDSVMASVLLKTHLDSDDNVCRLADMILSCPQVKLDLFFYTLMIQRCLYIGKLSLAKDLFVDLDRRGIVADAMVYELLICAYKRARTSDVVQALEDLAKRRGVVIDRKAASVHLKRTTRRRRDTESAAEFYESLRLNQTRAHSNPRSATDLSSSSKPESQPTVLKVNPAPTSSPVSARDRLTSPRNSVPENPLMRKSTSTTVDPEGAEALMLESLVCGLDGSTRDPLMGQVFVAKSSGGTL
ncbi:uncharacterized protein BJ171DRAFT_578596 [Polychytrium aggregatum]|uniref:uncharacterized protein n=1 Tax=Polychytrium aggregatum TaxID=110093 RepID=UPI0022FE9887|nr:uncharacterized protein BJ171DRAFT_578596 [Polychytrium aggregatum]KAI9207477.1 hypothetical protein BJ171DRAFT_578596 [Polychytrium aggregatum]